ncbi:hypothetical protein EON76_05115 [bacterium]|nr:MAG: hypothetical protein EON76_05115 [bacterium]
MKWLTRDEVEFLRRIKEYNGQKCKYSDEGLKSPTDKSIWSRLEELDLIKCTGGWRWEYIGPPMVTTIQGFETIEHEDLFIGAS